MPLNKNAADAVSRIPYHLAAAAIICLMRPEPGTCNVASNGSSPIWSCCGRSLPCGGTLITARWALTPPFHPYRRNPRRSALCCTGLTAEYSLRHPSFQRGSLLCAVRTFLNAEKYSPRRDCPRLPRSNYNITTLKHLCKKNSDFFSIIPIQRFSNNRSTCVFSGGVVSRLTTINAITESGKE